MTASATTSILSPPAVAIIGAEMVSGLGLSREQTWQAIVRGGCALRPLTVIESPLPLGSDGGEALPLPGDFAPSLPREARYLKWTIAAALRDAAAFPALPYPPHRCAVALGTTLHGMRAAGRFFRSGNFDVLRDFLAGDTLRHAIEGIGLAGLSVNLCSACSSSLAAIAMGVMLLQSNQADLVIAGGYDAIGEYVYGGFSSLRLVAPGPLKPFARDRAGMKLAEGYGIVILERSADAERRKASPLAMILGAAESSDAHHLTQPHPQGDGATRAMRNAISAAGLTPADIDLVAAHATGTRDNDAGEFAAFSNVFGEHLPQIPVVAFKSHLGHTLGGAGAVELILSAMALREQTIPACANVAAEEVEFPGLQLATGQSRRATLRTTLNTSLGFGGANACVILGKPATRAISLSPGTPGAGGGEGSAGKLPREDPHPNPLPMYWEREQEGHLNAAARETREVFITGIGVVLPGIVGNPAFLAHLNSGAAPAWRHDGGSVAESLLEGLLNARRVRRMSDYVKLTLAAATLAVRDAGIDDAALFCRDCSATLGTMHGSAGFSVEYYRQIVSEGLIAANPTLFAEGVPNSGVAQLSLMLGIKGPCLSVIGTRTAGLDALALAAARIRAGQCERAIAGGGEEYNDVVTEAHRRCGAGAAEGCPPFSGTSGCASSAGAVLFVLESRQSMEARGGRAHGRIEATSAAYGDPRSAVQSILRVLTDLDNPADIISSACGAWIDRAEALAIRVNPGARSVSSIHGHISETYSVGPLAGIAAALLGGKLPRLLGDGWDANSSVRAAAGDESIRSFAALCSDFSGPVSGVRVALI